MLNPDNQLSLPFFVTTPRSTRARRSDPMTSHLAAASIEGQLADHHEVILAALRKIRAGTFYDIARACKLSGWQVSRRLGELHSQGRIKRAVGACGDTVRKMGDTGRLCDVWVLA